MFTTTKNFTKTFLIFSLLATAVSAFTPANHTWYFPGTDVDPVSMRFLKDGGIILRSKTQPAYTWLGPIQWSYSEEEHELTLTMPKAKLEDLKKLKEKEGKPAFSYTNPKRVELEQRKVIYNFPDRIDFFGIVLEQYKQ